MEPNVQSSTPNGRGSVGAAVQTALRRRLFDLLKDLHSMLLDTLRIGANGVGEEAQKRIAVETLENLLAKVDLKPDLEEFLAMEALREQLIDLIHGYGKD